MAWMITDIIDMLKDWPLGTILAILLLAMAILIIGLVALGIYWAADSWWRPLETGMGQVKGKEYTPAHTTVSTSYNVALKMPMTTTTHHPADWSLTVEVNDQEGSISVEESFYDRINEGRKVHVEFVLGRLSGDLYLRSITF